MIISLSQFEARARHDRLHGALSAGITMLPRGERYGIQKLIACEVLFREICYCAAGCSNIVDITFMEKGLHDVGAKKMSEKLQAEIDRVDAEKYDAILLCYGLCNNGISGLRSPLPLVIPRAHDCITLLMGSKEKYRAYFDKNPGYFLLVVGVA